MSDPLSSPSNPAAATPAPGSTPMPSGASRLAAAAPKAIIVTTVMLTFISFWRAAALVLNDLASTAYYIGGIAEHAIGKAAPWFILFVMVFSYAVRWIYMESCTMFTRGGVYRIVREAMGNTMAKIAVSALVFDFVLTGPISAVSAGHYIHSFLESLGQRFGWHLPGGMHVSSSAFSIVVALAMTAYFWRLNIRGVEESSDRALKIMIVTAVMVVVLDAWSILTAMQRGFVLPPFEVKLDANALGWLKGVPWVQTISLAVFFVGLGHTLLAMSGEEALAQVYREIEAPKHKNLKKAALVVFALSILFTGFVSFACFALVPEEQRLSAGENLLNALVLNLVGPELLKLAMVAFVVVVGALILAGAVNTSIFASNGVLNRVAEDGILADWFRHPHRRFGTTHRIIHLVAAMQVVTILASRGDVTILGEAYAFGVIWSFAFMAVSMFILRFKKPGHRPLQTPLNIPLGGGKEFPIGILIIVTLLVGVAITNLFTKPVATKSGVAFTAAFFALFWVSEHLTRRRQGLEVTLGPEGHREKFILDQRAEIGPEAVDMEGARRRVLVPIRDPNNLAHLRHVLEQSHGAGTEVVVLTVKVERGETSFDHMFTRDEEVLFTKVVELAENSGEQIVPIVVPSNNSWYAIVKTAVDIEAAEIVLGMSGKVSPDVVLEQVVVMWSLVNDRADRRVKVSVVGSDTKEVTSVEL